MLNNKKITMVLSLVLAIGLWAYVVGEINPTTKETYKDVDINLINQEALTNQDLAIKSVSADTMDISLTGQRAALAHVKSTDIYATVDLSEATVGENEIKIIIKTPEDTEIDEKSLSKVTVEVEKSVSVSKAVEVYFEGEYEQGEEPTALDVSKHTVVVTGAESLVNTVDHVAAVVDSTKVTDELRSFKATLVPVTKEGPIVKNVTLSSSTAYVSAMLGKTKTVTLNVPIMGQNSNDVKRTVTVPKTITIKGTTDKLAAIESINAQTLDLSDVMSTSELEVIPILPDGVSVAKNSDNLVVSVIVKAYDSKTFTFNKDDITITGQDDEQQVTIETESVDVTITGDEEEISKITADDIKLHINIGGVASGNHRVDLRVTCDGNYSKLTTDPASVKVLVE